LVNVSQSFVAYNANWVRTAVELVLLCSCHMRRRPSQIGFSDQQGKFNTVSHTNFRLFGWRH